jgi:hypothetical protein
VDLPGKLPACLKHASGGEDLVFIGAALATKQGGTQMVGVRATIQVQNFAEERRLSEEPPYFR